jgi:hypothetical protein
MVWGFPAVELKIFLHRNLKWWEFAHPTPSRNYLKTLANKDLLLPYKSKKGRSIIYLAPASSLRRK